MTRYDKLVRDRIPEIVAADGKQPVVHVADDEEYERRLREKLREEADEFAESGDLEELADVLEVIDAVLENQGASRARLERLRREKRDRRGKFSKRIVLERVESDDADS